MDKILHYLVDSFRKYMYLSLRLNCNKLSVKRISSSSVLQSLAEVTENDLESWKVCNKHQPNDETVSGYKFLLKDRRGTVALARSSIYMSIKAS